MNKLNPSSMSVADRLRQIGFETKDEICHCSIHGDYMGAVTRKNGQIISVPACPKCCGMTESEMEDKKRAEEVAELIREDEARKAETAGMCKLADLRAMGLPEDYFGKLIDDVRDIDPTVTAAKKHARQYVDGFVEKYGPKGIGLCFFGSMGTGKTMLASAILQELAVQKVKCLYASIWDLMRACKEADSFRGDDSELIRLMKAELLIIDEMGANNGFGFEESYIMQLVDTRVANRRPTIYLTNLPPDVDPEKVPKGAEIETLRSKLGDRVFNRICGTTLFVCFRGESQRKRIMSLDEVEAM